MRTVIWTVFLALCTPLALAQDTATDEQQQAQAENAQDAEEAQRLDNCLLQASKTLNGKFTLNDMRNWCINKEEAPSISAHEDALRARFALERSTQSNPFVITPHRRNYIMPYSYWSNPRWNDPDKNDDELQNNEVKFQLSLKAPMAENLWGDMTLWAAFTGIFYWQAYNSELSAPFREANYEPEVFLSNPVDWEWGPIDSEMVSLGFSHQSNGKDVPVSRSWNRIYINYVFKTGDNYWMIKPWYRLKESSKDSPLDPQGDDNPDIEHYLGHFELDWVRPFSNRVLEITVRNNLRSENRGSGKINFTFPLSKRFRGIVQAFTGYGDSLINYDDYENRFSFGVLLTDTL